ncbi:MAG: preprotein translocase subunit YajC [Egibacteraceae bacterium]
MNFLFSILAQAQPAPGRGGLVSLLPFVAIAVVFYFLIVRPQRTRAQQQRRLVDSLGSGDRVVTIGGLHGTIQSVDEDTVQLELAPNVVVTFAKQAIARRMVDDDDDSDADDSDLEQAESD